MNMAKKWHFWLKNDNLGFEMKILKFLGIQPNIKHSLNLFDRMKKNIGYHMLLMHK